MSAQKVLEEMILYYQATGQVMQKEVFVTLVASKFETDEIINGLIGFNNFLDEQRIATKC